ncbi:hypothetical protein HCX48_01065 [Rhodocyclus tenuis]|uniref:Transmembrane protein n=2 Tax=Rhodocyclus TaxID=1064 RepID=A0A6L5JSG8_RHOTE|nr:hypothetical protein [Rhodocyclus gracilis]MQY50315.1 hypothetical protein [Rhodocyclus gracilis]MRD71788.1 hypothetical protein [Rhodocyclus gracilis]NJA87818.1 hypothetical protein [Rhodocyclus gracilis]
MYIVAIAWLYVTVLMALTEHSVVAGVLTFVFYGLLPTALLIFITGGPTRRRRRLLKAAEQSADESDGRDTQRDQ